MAFYIAGSSHPIDTGETYFTEISKEKISGSGLSNKLLAKRLLLAKKEVYRGEPLLARIEHSRWLVDCPNCNSAEFAFEDNLFFCSLCKNSDIQGKIRKVTMPNDRKQIEDMLSKRAIKNRHWFPNETIKDLQNENILHGLEVI